MPEFNKSKNKLLDDAIKRLANETTENVFGQLIDEAFALHKQGGGAIESLFLVDRARELKKFCKLITISQSEFVKFITACQIGLVPWRHQISHREFVPEHLRITDDERKGMTSAKVGGPLPKAFRKIISTFHERRLLVGHIFFHDDPALWHLIYFDQRDTSRRGNHWVAGEHLHLVNWLLRPGQSASQMWDEFRDGNPNIKGALHIKSSFQRDNRQNTRKP